jgi:hypothetical protein
MWLRVAWHSRVDSGVDIQATQPCTTAGYLNPISQLAGQW